MKLEEIQLLYEYNYWASAKILTAATDLTQEQFVAPTSHTFGSLRGTMVHVAAAEWIWRMRIDEKVGPTQMLDEADFATLEDLIGRFQEEERKMRGYLIFLTEEQLNAPITYTTTSGASHTQILWEILMHVLLHGMQHRAEAAAILTDFEHSPGDIDLIGYLRSRG